MSIFRILFKNFILKIYSLKKSNCSISNILNTYIFIKAYYLKFLKSISWAPVSIFLKIIGKGAFFIS
jgi:hypothetical protein